jgi:hypothetical protein
LAAFRLYADRQNNQGNRDKRSLIGELSMPQQNDPILAIADNVADMIADSGYAYVEDEHLDGLAVALRSFLSAAGIPVNPELVVAHLRERHTGPAVNTPGSTTETSRR